MDMTIDAETFERIRVCAAAQQEDEPTDAEVLACAYQLLEKGLEEAEDDLVDLGDQG